MISKENAHEYLPLIKALADGKTVEINTYSGEWQDEEPYEFSSPASEYRIKPESAMIPLGPEDVPPGSAFRYIERKSGYQWIAITKVGDESIYLEHFGLTLERAMHLGEIKRPGEDWKPCCKPANQ